MHLWQRRMHQNVHQNPIVAPLLKPLEGSLKSPEFILDIPSLKLTFSSLKMDGWNTILSLWGQAYFQVRTVGFREGKPLPCNIVEGAPNLDVPFTKIIRPSTRASPAWSVNTERPTCFLGRLSTIPAFSRKASAVAKGANGNGSYYQWKPRCL